MTVKRFILKSDYDWWFVKDTTGEIKGEYDEWFSDKEVVDLLNALHEENKQLRIEKDTAQKQHSYELNKKLQYKSKLIDLKKENEKLKQRIKELELLNDGLNYALQNIRKIDVEIDVGGKK